MRSIFSKALLVGSLFALPAGLMLIATSFWPNSGLMQPNGFYLGHDFVNYWTGGRLAILGQVDTAYDLVGYNALLREWFSPQQELMSFSYPPHALPLLAPFGALPYLVALPLWSLLGVLGFAAVALGRWPARNEIAQVGALALAPVIWVNVVFGQLDLLLTVLFVGALRALPTRPVLAGLLIGALTIKPQLGLLLPLALLALGAWRALAAAIASALVLAALSVAVFGLEPWHLYVSETMPLQWGFVTRMDGFYRFQMITPYSAFWFLGVPVQIALVLQAAVSLLIAVTTYFTLRGGAPWSLKAAVLAFGSVMMVPYAMAYDLAIPYAALVWYLMDGKPRAELADVALAGGMWALPFAVAIFMQMQGVPLLPIALLVCYFWLVREALGRRSIRLGRSAMASTEA